MLDCSEHNGPGVHVDCRTDSRRAAGRLGSQATAAPVLDPAERATGPPRRDRRTSRIDGGSGHDQFGSEPHTTVLAETGEQFSRGAVEMVPALAGESGRPHGDHPSAGGCLDRRFEAAVAAQDGLEQIMSEPRDPEAAAGPERQDGGGACDRPGLTTQGRPKPLGRRLDTDAWRKDDDPLRRGPRCGERIGAVDAIGGGFKEWRGALLRCSRSDHTRDLAERRCGKGKERVVEQIDSRNPVSDGPAVDPDDEPRDRCAVVAVRTRMCQINRCVGDASALSYRAMAHVSNQPSADSMSPARPAKGPADPTHRAAFASTSITTG